jgi:hypothetical protein
VAMRPLPNNQRAVATGSATAAMKSHNEGANLTVSQASSAIQAATVNQGTSVSNTTSPNVAQYPYPISGPTTPISVPPATPSTAPPAEPDMLYPIDPIPCKNIDMAWAGCWPKCPGRGIEMMCAYPL